MDYGPGSETDLASSQRLSECTQFALPWMHSENILSNGCIEFAIFKVLSR